MTDPRFDALIHEPTRLQLCGMLVTVRDVEFRTLRDALAIADSVTSKHLKVLEDAGYVELDKRRPRSAGHGPGCHSPPVGETPSPGTWPNCNGWPR